MAETTGSSSREDVKAGTKVVPAYSYYVLAILFLAYASNSIDRGILAILQEPIRHAFNLSDSQLGVLGGVTFAIFYSTLGLPIAALADRTNRRNVLALSITLWSVATALCGAATGFFTLAIARIGTAVGESGGTPPSNSLIADYFPREMRATALSIYALAIPIGAMVGSFGGGWANVYLGWRWAFVVAGLPGVAIALLMLLTVREPRRGMSDGIAVAAVGKAPPVREVLRLLWSRASFRHMSAGAALHAFYFYAAANFGTSFFVRSHHMSTGQAGNWLALFAGLGAFGIFIGGFLADHLARKTGNTRWYLWMPAGAHVVMVPFLFFCYLANDLSVVIPCFIVMTICNSVFFGPTAAMVQALVTLRMRAVAASFLIFIQTIIGLSLGPLLAGLISDHLKPEYGEDALRYALVIVGLINLWSALHYYLGAGKLPGDLAATDALMASKA